VVSSSIGWPIIICTKFWHRFRTEYISAAFQVFFVKTGLFSYVPPAMTKAPHILGEKLQGADESDI
jgi:hypothetical protein